MTACSLAAGRPAGAPAVAGSDGRGVSARRSAAGGGPAEGGVPRASQGAAEPAARALARAYGRWLAARSLLGAGLRHWSAGGNGLLALAEFHARYERASQGHPFRWNCWNICAVDPLAICQKLWLLRSRVSFETARRAVGRHVMSCRCEMRPNFICLSLPAKCCCGGKGACSISTSDARPLVQPILHTTLLPKATPLLLSLQCKCSLACAVRPSSASPPRPRSPLWSATPACRRLISLARRPRSSRFLHHPRQAASSRLPFHAGSSSCLLPPARPRLSFP